MDDQDRKIVLGMISYGVYILTSKLDNEVSAATVTWVCQSSFKPPMISVCIKRNSGSYKVIKERREFLLHMLGEDQKELASKFLKPSRVENDRINGEIFEIENDLPLLKAAPSHILCHVHKILDNGDHPLFLAEVKDVMVREDVAPLELRKTGWSYGG